MLTSNRARYGLIGTAGGLVIAMFSLAIVNQTDFFPPMIILIALFPDGVFYLLGGNRLTDILCKPGGNDYIAHSNCLAITTDIIHTLTWLVVGFAIGWLIGYRSERKQHVRI